MSRVRTAVVLSLIIVISFFFSASRVLAADKTIGVIMTGDIFYYKDVHNAFLSKINKEGLADKVEIIVQRPYPDPISLSNAARKLIALEVDVIVAYGTPATLAVLAEKTKIPIVYVGVYEPLTSKIRGKNVTGISSRVSLSSLLRYLRQITPIATLGVVYSTNEEDSTYQMRELIKAGEQYGFRVEKINLTRFQDAKAMLSGKRPDAVFITGSSIANMASASIMDFCRELRIPSVSLLPDKGNHATVTLYPSPKEQGERGAEKAIKVLRNTPVETIRADASSDTELVFNLREAKDIGLKIPINLVTEATKLVQ